MRDRPIRTLVLLYRGCIGYEVQLAAELLSRAGTVDVATPDGGDAPLGNGIVARAAATFARIASGRHDSKAVSS